MDTAAQLYQEAAIREQVRASLGSMPSHIRKLFQGNTSTPLTESQLQAVNQAAIRAFRIDVFDAPALSAFAANLDADTLKKAEAFLVTDTGKRMVAADVALASLERRGCRQGHERRHLRSQHTATRCLVRETGARRALCRVHGADSRDHGYGRRGRNRGRVGDGSRTRRTTRSQIRRSQSPNHGREHARTLAALSGIRLSQLERRGFEARVVILCNRRPASNTSPRILPRWGRLLRHGQALRRTARREPARIGDGAASD